MTILYCECFSGISGDMFLAALIDAGLPIEHLSKQLDLIHLPEFHGFTAQKALKGALVATSIKFEIHEHEHDHGQHDHDHDHHRNFSDIKDLIESSGLSSKVCQTTLSIFQKLAEAEAKVHGTTVDEVHFHEVGAADSILDIVGAAVGLDYFNIQSVYSSALPLGSGKVMTQHGLLPLPAPATMELIRMAEMPVVSSSATSELVTPTGAAILASQARFCQPGMRIQFVGMGAGQRDLEWPNILRIMIGTQDNELETHIEIETNIDDMNPQLFGSIMKRLFESSALDVYFTPIYMKKNRPATKLSVIARKEDEEKICDLLLRETSTLGVRITPVKRHEAEREIREIETRYGKIHMKLKFINDQYIQAVPEFDDCVRAAEQTGITVQQVIQETLLTSQELFGKH